MANRPPRWQPRLEESLQLAAILQLRDLRILDQDSKGEHPEGKLRDSDLAAQLYEQELRNYVTYFNDRRMAGSISDAIGQDAATIRMCAAEELQARADREMALATAHGRQAANAPAAQPSNVPQMATSQSDEMLRAFLAPIAPPPEPASNKRKIEGDGSHSSERNTKAPHIDLTAQRSTTAATAATASTASTASNKRKIDGDGSNGSERNAKAPHIDPAAQRSATASTASKTSMASTVPTSFIALNATAAKNNQPVTRHCHVCLEHKPIHTVARLSCGHDYCAACLQGLVRSSLTDVSLFPPRCCRIPLPLSPSFPLVPPELIRAFEEKTAELNTPNRTYCSRNTCSVFIKPAGITGDVATCGVCRTKTCTICKAGEHGGDCPNDIGLQQVLEMAKREGWKRCHSCSAVVELAHGCNHMTCRCGGEFCYECEARWKTCGCDEWDEQRLIERGQYIAQRQQPAAAAGQMADLVARQVANLRANHVCNHEGWQRIDGRNRCEGCGDRLPYFIHECTQCYVMACSRCRYNRNLP